ncbi:hypothetical protein BJV78DRAFT_495147 [Lactifluus subvellereus]|nr:hypothetical protein BJV78DRAFT_495147 [Lactifluus subvellereus]
MWAHRAALFHFFSFPSAYLRSMPVQPVQVGNLLPACTVEVQLAGRKPADRLPHQSLLEFPSFSAIGPSSDYVQNKNTRRRANGN